MSFKLQLTTNENRRQRGHIKGIADCGPLEKLVDCMAKVCCGLHTPKIGVGGGQV